MFLTTGAVNKDVRSKIKFRDNYFNNILGLFDAVPTFLFTTSEMMNYHYWYTQCIPVTKQLNTYNLRKLGNISKVSKLHRMLLTTFIILIDHIHYIFEWRLLFALQLQVITPLYVNNCVIMNLSFFIFRSNYL